MDLDGVSVSLHDVMEKDHNQADVLYVIDSNDLMEGDGEGHVLLQIGDEEPKEFEFKLPDVPGSDSKLDDVKEEIVIDEDDDLGEIEVQHDPWAWDHDTFLDWLKEKMQKVPSHSGKDSTGVERAMAYLDKLDKEISKCVRSDFDNKVTVDVIERVRDEIHSGIERLEDRYKKLMSGKRKKKADEQYGLVKEGKTARINGISVTVPLFISAIVRACIGSHISNGRDIEDSFEKMSKKYELTTRERLEAIQLFSDFNMPFNVDMGAIDEEYDPTSSQNLLAPNYPA